MRYEGEVRIRWSWAELQSVRDAVELTPPFAGRGDVRAALRRRPKTGHVRDVKLDLVLAEHLAENLLALDMPTAIAKSKLLRAVQHAHRRPAEPGAAEAA